MSVRDLFEANLAVIERAIEAVGAQASLRGADAEDFASAVKLELLENDCAILRKWEGRSSFATYITIVIRRLLVDQRRAGGRFYASVAARRQGDAAVMLERLIARDGRSVGEAIEMVRAAHPEVPASQLSAMAAALPERAPRARMVAMADHHADRFAAAQRADEEANDFDHARRSAHASRIVRDAMYTLTAEDRLILRMRFGKGTSIADIARMLAVAQRPLYRRIEAMLAVLRRALEREGLDSASIADLIGGSDGRLDFRLAWKSDPALPSVRGSAEGQR
ncbi:MAG TPA: sigma-70 family RNA polymerase sigma factor [Thermoanaerobaculia bacterium]